MNNKDCILRECWKLDLECPTCCILFISIGPPPCEDVGGGGGGGAPPPMFCIMLISCCCWAIGLLGLLLPPRLCCSLKVRISNMKIMTNFVTLS